VTQNPPDHPTPGSSIAKTSGQKYAGWNKGWRSRTRQGRVSKIISDIGYRVLVYAPTWTEDLMKRRRRITASIRITAKPVKRADKPACARSKGRKENARERAKGEKGTRAESDSRQA